MKSFDEEEDFDYCQLIQRIADNPFAKVPDMTIRRLLGLRAHVVACDECADRVERVHEEYPDPPSNWDQSGLN